MTALPFSQAFGTLGFGAAPLGNLFRAVTDAQAEATLETAWNGGIRYFDTAPHYGLGLSERRLGRFLAGRPRDEFVLSTKVGRLLRPRVPALDRDDDVFDVPGDVRRVRDDSRRGVRASLEESLDRLGLDRVDIVWLHDPDDVMEQALAEAVPALRELREEGTIRAWGVGMNSAQLLQRFVLEADPDLVMLAGRHTLLEPVAALPLLEDCAERGVGVVAVGVFNSGILAQDLVPDSATHDYQPAPPELLDRARDLAARCRAAGTSLPAAALAFPRRHPAVVNVTVGMSSPEQVTRNLALAATPVPADVLEAASVIVDPPAGGPVP